MDVNTATALKRNISEAKLLAIATFADSALFSDREKAALVCVETMTYSERRPAAYEFARLREHFSDDAIIELTALISFQNLSSKFNAALQVPPQGFCSLSPVLCEAPTIRRGMLALGGDAFAAACSVATCTLTAPGARCSNSTVAVGGLRASQAYFLALEGAGAALLPDCGVAFAPSLSTSSNSVNSLSMAAYFLDLALFSIHLSAAASRSSLK